MNNYIRKILFLGPTGSNSQYACDVFMKKLDIKAEKEGVSTITKAIELLDSAPDDVAAILPIENSIEGIVRETIDNLVKTKSGIYIQAEMALPICHCLISKGRKEQIKTVVSITQAVAQCKNYISRNFGKNINILLYTSTSAAARFVQEKGEEYAAIASKYCAQIYGLNVLDEAINDVSDNKTNFILVSKKSLFKENKTRTLIAFTTENKPGALLSVLEILKKYDLNMIYLESRPSKKVFGEYIFYAEVDKAENEIEKALDEIKIKSTYQKILGSYFILE